MTKKPRTGIKRPVDEQAQEYHHVSHPHTIWVRDDVWFHVKATLKKLNKERKEGTRKYTIKQVIEWALYNQLVRPHVKQEYNLDLEIEDTVCNPETKQTEPTKEIIEHGPR